MRLNSTVVLGLAAAVDPVGFVEAFERLSGPCATPRATCARCGWTLARDERWKCGVCVADDERAETLRARHAAKLARRAARNKPRP